MPPLMPPRNSHSRPHQLCSGASAAATARVRVDSHEPYVTRGSVAASHGDGYVVTDGPNCFSSLGCHILPPQSKRELCRPGLRRLLGVVGTPHRASCPFDSYGRTAARGEDSVTNTKPSQLVVVSSQADKRALGVLSDSYQWTCPSIESLLNRALPPDPPGTSHLL